MRNTQDRVRAYPTKHATCKTCKDSFPLSSSGMSKPYVQAGEPLNEFLRSFWQRQVDAAEQETPDYRHPPLPLARIKKVMKSDPDVKMIAADAPILFCKACEIFISEITARAFIIADSNKRRTLSRADIAKALSKSDQFDFLIDIVPRDEPFPPIPASLSNAGIGSSKKSGVPGNRRDHGSSHQDSDAQVASLELQEEEQQDGLSSSAVLDQLQSLLNPPGSMDRGPMSR